VLRYLGKGATLTSFCLKCKNFRQCRPHSLPSQRVGSYFVLTALLCSGSVNLSCCIFVVRILDCYPITAMVKLPCQSQATRHTRTFYLIISQTYHTSPNTVSRAKLSFVRAFSLRACMADHMRARRGAQSSRGFCLSLLSFYVVGACC
jgi:hypothetical protein